MFVSVFIIPFFLKGSSVNRKLFELCHTLEIGIGNKNEMREMFLISFFLKNKYINECNIVN